MNREQMIRQVRELVEGLADQQAMPDDSWRPRLAAVLAALAAPVAADPVICCPACGEQVTQISSATLSLALWQHWNWACKRRPVAVEPPSLVALVDALKAHAKEHGWQDVDEPIAALLAWTPAQAEPAAPPSLRAAFDAGFQWGINGTDKHGDYNGGPLEQGFAEFLGTEPAALPAVGYDYGDDDGTLSRAADMGREALALIGRAVRLIDGGTDSEYDALEAEFRALLARAGEES